MTGRTFHNHPSVILDNLPLFIAIAIFVAIDMYAEGNVSGAFGALALLIGVPTVVAVAIWKRTTVTFTESDIEVRKDTAVFKTDKTIQYDRLASIGVKRGIFDRIFGTTTLQFNVNSSVNATVPEATLRLEMGLADAVRDELNALVFSKSTTVVEERDIESLVRVSNKEILIHSFLSQSTPQMLFAVIMLLYCISSVIMQNSTGLVMSLLLFALEEVIPMIRVILRYFNYRLYRIDDTITIESGLITTTRSSFSIAKVNSVRMRRPLLARAFGLTTLEAEVVGLADSGDSDAMCPLLCPLKPKGEVDALLRSLFPGIVVGAEPIHQGQGALRSMVVRDAVYTIAIMAVLILSLTAIVGHMIEVDDPMRPIVMILGAVAIVLVPLLMFGHCWLAQRNRSFAMGEDSFLFIHGAYDVSEEHILYDRVQYATVSAGVLDRVFGVAYCTVAMMSSVGFKEVRSGLFPPMDLERVPEEVMSRIRDGRYDHRRFR